MANNTMLESSLQEVIPSNLRFDSHLFLPRGHALTRAAQTSNTRALVNPCGLLSHAHAASATQACTGCAGCTVPRHTIMIFLFFADCTNPWGWNDFKAGRDQTKRCCKILRNGQSSRVYTSAEASAEDIYTTIPRHHIPGHQNRIRSFPFGRSLYNR
jgi:hypothetical protein